MIALLGIPYLVWIGSALVAGIIALGFLAGWIIRGPETPPFIAPCEPEQPADLDDWLAGEGLDFDFEVYRQPEASVQMVSTGAERER